MFQYSSQYCLPQIFRPVHCCLDPQIEKLLSVGSISEFRCMRAAGFQRENGSAVLPSHVS